MQDQKTQMHIPIAVSTPRCRQSSLRSLEVTTFHPLGCNATFSDASHWGEAFVDTNTLSSSLLPPVPVPVAPFFPECSASNLRASSLSITAGISIQHRSNAYWRRASPGSVGVDQGGDHLSGRNESWDQPLNSPQGAIHSQSGVFVNVPRLDRKSSGGLEWVGYDE